MGFPEISRVTWQVSGTYGIWLRSQPCVFWWRLSAKTSVDSVLVDTKHNIFGTGTSRVNTCHSTFNHTRLISTKVAFTKLCFAALCEPLTWGFVINLIFADEKNKHRNGKIVGMTALVVIGNIEACLQHNQWRSGHEPDDHSVSVSHILWCSLCAKFEDA